MRKFICLFIGCCILVGLFSSCGEQNQMEEHDMLFIGFPDGRPATYQKIERELCLNDFQNVEIGMSYNEIVDLIGEPNGTVGAGFLYPYYELLDGSYLLLHITSEDILFGLCIVDSKGRTYKYDQFE